MTDTQFLILASALLAIVVLQIVLLLRARGGAQVEFRSAR